MDDLIQPEKHKIIYYDFRKNPPEVEPLKKSGDSPQPRGNEPSKQTVIATDPKAKSTQQMIWLPASQGRDPPGCAADAKHDCKDEYFAAVPARPTKGDPSASGGRRKG